MCVCVCVCVYFRVVSAGCECVVIWVGGYTWRIHEHWCTIKTLKQKVTSKFNVSDYIVLVDKRLPALARHSRGGVTVIS